MEWWNNLKLSSKSAEVRAKAIENLDGPDDKRTLELLMAALEDESEQVRTAAMQAFKRIQPSNAGPALISAAFHSPNPGSRQAAVAALGHLGDPRTARELTGLLKDADPFLRNAAAVSLKKLGWRPSDKEEQALFDVALGNTRAATFVGEAALRPLLTELKHDTSFQRRAAAEALANVSDPRRIQPLLIAAQDPDANVRVSAIHALGRERSNEVTAALLKPLRDSDSCVRLAAAQELAKREDKSHDTAFIELLGDTHFEVRLTAVQFLGKRKDSRFATALLSRLSDKDSDVRLAAAKALGAIGDATTIEALVLSLTDEEKTVREAVESALEQIDRNWAATEEAKKAITALESSLEKRPAWVRSAVNQVLVKLRGNVVPVENCMGFMVMSAPKAE
jgi:HEAT repeat protein